MSRTLPILFNTEMVKAILDGRKTVTRRLVKFEGNRNPNWTGYIKDGLTLYNGTNEPCNKSCPYQPGDILYVRETWTNDKLIFGKHVVSNYHYKADGNMKVFDSVGREVDYKWKPSLHMPKEATRIFLKVKNVRVEKLQNITEEQAIAEGIRGYTKDEKLYKYAVSIDWWEEFHYKHKKMFKGNWWQDMPRTAKEAFHHLWNSTLGKRDTPEWYANNWSGNPWVWVIEFEQCEKPNGF